MEFQGEGLNMHLARLVFLYLEVHLNVFVYLANVEKLNILYILLETNKHCDWDL